MSPVLAIAALCGLTLGSFCATYAVRTARAEQALTGRSRCDRCDQTLDMVDTLPVAGFLIRRGKCRHCGAKIDPLHLVGELGGAVILTMALVIAPPFRASLLAILALSLLTGALIDLRTQRLPDLLTLIVALCGLGLAVETGGDAVLQGFAAAVLSGIFLLGIRWTGRYLGRPQAMGLGDIKLISALSLWLGIAIPWMLALASILGLVAIAFKRPTDGRIAFGPCLAISAMVVGAAMEAHLPGLAS